MSSASPCSQASKPGDASRPLMRSASSVRSFAGIEALEVEDADLVERRLLHGLDQRREVEALAVAPGRVEQRGQQDELAAADRIGIDTEQSEQARRRPNRRAP